MWESPVNIIMGEMQTKIEGDVYKAIQNVGIDVDKEELLKAMQYDRQQYEKGYKDGYADAVDELKKKFMEQLEVKKGIWTTRGIEFNFAGGTTIVDERAFGIACGLGDAIDIVRNAGKDGSE